MNIPNVLIAIIDNSMNIDDHWMRPRTKAGTDEMRKRIKVMKSFLEEAVKLDATCSTRVAQKVFEEYFTFEWE